MNAKRGHVSVDDAPATTPDDWNTAFVTHSADELRKAAKDRRRADPQAEHEPSFTWIPPADPLPRNAGPVRLRRLRTEDLPSFHAYRSDLIVARYQGWSPMSEAAALDFISIMSRQPLFVPGEWGQIAIATVDADALVGDVGLLVAEGSAFAEIGFTLHPRFTGRGYATAAVREALRLLFELTPVQRVIGVTDARNTPSVKVLERAGMCRLDTRETLFKGEPCLEWIYAISR